MRPLGDGFGLVLGPLGRSWSPLGRLGRVLGASWGYLERHMKHTLETSSKNEPNKA